ncbi:six-hairpin glycosidase [Parabacteroides gordonii]|uniref:six-hairpin glycosidase n=1 Tax=Parabacteroides gordonii TaxID=574930 RepID=UPI0026EFEFD7|nr:six-hairpin glycosidase [Parabacteroides gordonii]
MKNRYLYLIMILLWGSCSNFPLLSQQINFKVNPGTGAISRLSIGNDGRDMNWLMETDGSQYAWIGENYGWGLGYFSETKEGKTIDRKWTVPVEISPDGSVCYMAGDIRIDVKRRSVGSDLLEEYTFQNKGSRNVTLSDVGIYTPFNDNYPDSKTCVSARTNAHIWAGENAAYVNAMHMGGSAPHLGLILKQGSVKSYQISERDSKRGFSNTRGLISLNLSDMHLKPGEKNTVSWVLFSHSGSDDFRNKVLEKDNVLVISDKYVFKKGETAHVSLYSKKPLNKLYAQKNGVSVPVKQEQGKWVIESPMEELGEVRFDFFYDGGKQTHASCLTISGDKELISKRTDFIIDRQQLNDAKDPRNGAYLVYDNDLDELFLNDRPTVSYHDRDEGAERLGMGVLLAKQYQLTHDPKIKASLMKYVKFVREKLQNEEYQTWSTVDHKGRNRAYNYPWVAILYFQMYKVTGDKQYLTDGYQTLQAMFRYFGYGFYAIDIPVQLALQTLKEAGMQKEYNNLKKDFLKIGDVYVKNGCNYPKHEVNFEQSIVGPSVMFLTQLYLETGIQKYLDEAKQQMPVLESFGGFQPSFHLNEIGIRHWDGYWFGKREMWGDVFPHYWSTLTAAAYHYYSLCTGDSSYRKRAENIVRNNLCLFFEDGKASCAYMYPYKVNGVKAGFYDPFANDQDWGLVYYILVNDNL